VQLSEGEHVRIGEQAIFYTQSMMVGESLAVQSFGHLPATTTTREAQTDPAWREQVTNADLVVTGKVSNVRTIPPAPARATRGPAESFSAISEHSPVWQEAVIEIAEVEKGTSARKQVIVRFPASTDVLWHQSPKFQPGQEAVFLLSRETAGENKSTRAAKQTASQPTRYTALDPAAVQPMQNVEAIRAVIRSRKS
jgi:hypothetical protein